MNVREELFARDWLMSTNTKEAKTNEGNRAPRKVDESKSSTK